MQQLNRDLSIGAMHGRNWRYTSKGMPSGQGDLLRADVFIASVTSALVTRSKTFLGWLELGRPEINSDK